MKRLASVILFAGIWLACSKNKTLAVSNSVLSSELNVQANDAVRVSAELDAAFNDVDSVLASSATVCGGALTVDSVDTPRVITITYNGNTCDAQRSRTGTIAISFTPGSSWNSMADSVTLNFTNYTVTRLADTKTLAFNGSYIYRNLSGGNLAGLSSGAVSSLVHTLVGPAINLTYDDGTLTRWQFTRQRTYTYSNGIIITTTGLDSAGSIGGVTDWGANRFGNSVVVAPNSPLVISQGCGWKTTAGQVTLSNPSGSSILTFGLDSTGNPTGCPLSGNHYYYKLAWTADGQSPYTTLLPY
jgi:hypothetical protein